MLPAGFGCGAGELLDFALTRTRALRNYLDFQIMPRYPPNYLGHSSFMFFVANQIKDFVTNYLRR